MKWIKISLATLFLLFAGVQYNDPDPWLWIFIYGLVSILYFISLVRKPPKRILLFLIIAGAAFSIIYIPGVYTWLSEGQLSEIVASMKVDKPYVEQSREFFGLWLGIIALLFLRKQA